MELFGLLLLTESLLILKYDIIDMLYLYFKALLKFVIIIYNIKY